jgi:phosphodiesterase/alkaline phosphatase D-like protein
MGEAVSKEDADLVVFNTCTIREKPDTKLSAYLGDAGARKRENPDLVIFLGDYIYENTYPDAQADRIVRKHDGPTASDLASYRNRYALYRTDADLQALHGAAPCLMTWDDHEVENDYANRRLSSVLRAHAAPRAVDTARQRTAPL